MSDTMSDQGGTGPDGQWTNWAAIGSYSGFRVRNDLGRVSLAQTGENTFVVSTAFAFVDPTTIEVYTRRLIAAGNTPEQARRRIDDARVLSASEAATDLASVPRFMGWFERPYGRHTLAAILHDNLIEGAPNSGPLGSDTLSDSFFRDMMGVACVPFFKRWLMWAAVAARTRWFAGTLRRISLAVWGTAAITGIAMAVLAIAGAAADLGAWDRPWLFALGAVGLPWLSGPLWGRQYGASLVGAAAGLWLVPAAMLVILGLAVYRASEWFVTVVLGHDDRAEPETVVLPSLPSA